MNAPAVRNPVRPVLLPVVVLFVVMALGVGFLAPAADHRDGPIFVNTQVNGQQDLNDMYIFQAPGNPNNTVLIYTVQPFTGSVTPVTFNQGQFFVLNID